MAFSSPLIPILICIRASAKQLKPHSTMTSLYLYSHLLHSILGLKCNVYTTFHHVIMIQQVKILARNHGSALLVVVLVATRGRLSWSDLAPGSLFFKPVALGLFSAICNSSPAQGHQPGNPKQKLNSYNGYISESRTAARSLSCWFVFARYNLSWKCWIIITC